MMMHWERPHWIPVEVQPVFQVLVLIRSDSLHCSDWNPQKKAKNAKAAPGNIQFIVRYNTEKHQIFLKNAWMIIFSTFTNQTIGLLLQKQKGMVGVL